MDVHVINYKRKAEDSESKLKDLRSLYDSVRMDRNLYSKNLLEANVSNAFLPLKLLVSRAARLSFVYSMHTFAGVSATTTVPMTFQLLKICSLTLSR